MIDVNMHDVVSVEINRKVFTKEMSSSGIPFKILNIVLTDKKGQELQIQAFTQGEKPLEIQS